MSPRLIELPGCCITEDSIEMIVSYDVNCVRKDVRNAKKNTNLVRDYTRGQKVRTVIYLLSGAILLFSVDFDEISKILGCD